MVTAAGTAQVFHLIPLHKEHNAHSFPNSVQRYSVFSQWQIIMPFFYSRTLFTRLTFLLIVCVMIRNDEDLTCLIFYYTEITRMWAG